MTDEEVEVVSRYSVVFLQIIKREERESRRQVPPKDVNRGAVILGRIHNPH